MLAIKSVTLRYDANEDRVLLAINANAPDSCAFWLTRRLALRLVERATPFMEKTSRLVAKAPSMNRDEISKMEREVALASSQQSMSKTPSDVVSKVASSGQLATEIKITAQGERFRLEIVGRDGASQVQGMVARSELQTFLHMVEVEIRKANWEGAPPAASKPADMPVEQNWRVN